MAAKYFISVWIRNSNIIYGSCKAERKAWGKGYSVSTTEARPTEALNLATSGRFDILTHTSPLPDGDYGNQQSMLSLVLQEWGKTVL